jgi:hypothetical protein
MPNDEDYYEILGVSSDATLEQIKEAYTYKVNILHPDRLAAMSERIRSLAEKDLKKVNMAYEVLSNPERRRQYDAKRFGKIGTVSDWQKTKPVRKPQPEVHPKTIYFNGVLPYVKQKGFFFVRNLGGPYEKVLISKTPEWLRVVKTLPLQGDTKLPMQVQIEAMGIQWGTVYSSEILVRLDENEARVKVELRTQKKPRKFFGRK